MKLALDTNRYVDLMRSVEEVVACVESASEVILPFSVLAELLAGFSNGTRREENERVLWRFLKRPLVHALYPDETTIAHYAALYTDLRRRGRMIPHNDLWISAICIQHALTLYSRDSHFDHLPQVARV